MDVLYQDGMELGEPKTFAIFIATYNQKVNS